MFPKKPILSIGVLFLLCKISASAVVDRVPVYASYYDVPIPESISLSIIEDVKREPSPEIIDAWMSVMNQYLPNLPTERSDELLLEALEMFDDSSTSFLTIRKKAEREYYVESMANMVHFDPGEKLFLLKEDKMQFVHNLDSFWFAWSNGRYFERRDSGWRLEEIPQVSSRIRNLYFLFDGGALRNILKGSKELRVVEGGKAESLVVGRYSSSQNGPPLSYTWFSFDKSEEPQLLEVGLASSIVTGGDVEIGIWKTEGWLSLDYNGRAFQRPRVLATSSSMIQGIEIGEYLDVQDVLTMRESQAIYRSRIEVVELELNPNFEGEAFSFRLPQDAPHTYIDSSGTPHFVRSQAETAAIAATGGNARSRGSAREEKLQEARLHQGSSLSRWLVLGGGLLLISLLASRMLRR